MKFLRIFLFSIFLVLVLLLLLRCEGNRSGKDVNPKDSRSRVDTVIRTDTVYKEFNNLVFRTVDAASKSVLPDCELQVVVNGNVLTTPVNSGSGVFTVDHLSENDEITIVASKVGHGVNNFTVNQDIVKELIKREGPVVDIPLCEEMPPCDTGGDSRNNVSKGNESISTYNLGRRGPGRFKFTYDSSVSVPDRFIVYNCLQSDIDHVSPIFDEDVVTGGKRSVYLEFTEPVITVRVIASGDGSAWDYYVDCPE